MVQETLAISCGFLKPCAIQNVRLCSQTQTGQVGGHEGVGEVVKLGPATVGNTIKVGDRKFTFPVHSLTLRPQSGQESSSNMFQGLESNGFPR